MLKNLPNFNGCTRVDYFSKAWEHAQMTIIPKPGIDPTISSYHKHSYKTFCRKSSTPSYTSNQIYSMPRIHFELPTLVFC